MVARKHAFAHAGRKIFVQTDRHKEPAQAERDQKPNKYKEKFNRYQTPIKKLW